MELTNKNQYNKHKFVSIINDLPKPIDFQGEQKLYR